MRSIPITVLDVARFLGAFRRREKRVVSAAWQMGGMTGFRHYHIDRLAIRPFPLLVKTGAGDEEEQTGARG